MKREKDLKTVTVVIKKTNDELSSFCIDSLYLERIVTNIKLYQKDLDFIASFVREYSNINCNGFLPSENGIIFIDMIDDVILDSQDITGINKITPTEVKMSQHGSVLDETKSNSMVTRFKELFDANRLKGFEVWQDNGHHLNKTVAELEYEDLLKMIDETNEYGQFVFNTSPYKIEMFYRNDFVEQMRLFNHATKLQLIPKDEHIQWKTYLKGLE